MRSDRVFLATSLALACALPAVAQVSASHDELTITENHGSKQRQPAIALVTNGSVLAWDDEAQGIVARRYNAAGPPPAMRSCWPPPIPCPRSRSTTASST